MTMLSKEADALLVVERDHGCAAGMMNDLEVCSVAVRQSDVIHRHRDHTAAELGGAVV
jgi:hypothetical protein